MKTARPTLKLHTYHWFIRLPSSQIIRCVDTLRCIMQIMVWVLLGALQLLIVAGHNSGGLMSFIHAFQRLYLIRHKGEINRRSRGAPASIPLQPSMHKPCLPPRPLTPQPLSDPNGGASSKRIPACRVFSQSYPPVTEQWAGVKGGLLLYSGASPLLQPVTD